MDLGYFKSVIDRIHFPVVVIPWLNGEALLNPNYFEMVRYITERGHRTYLTTNGHFWNDELFEHITDDTSCYQIIVSIDGLPGSPSITAARPGSRPEKVLDTIDRLLELKRKKHSKLDIAVKLVERGQDWEEIERYVAYWLRRGVDYVCVGRMLDTETVEPMRMHPCQYYDNNFMVIRHDGELVLCAYNERVVNHGENPLFMLDSKRPLLDAYNDKRYQKYRRNQHRGVYDGPCANCGYAYTGHGFAGKVMFRNPGLIQEELFYHQDHYNAFFSLVDRRKPDNYYQRGEG